VLLDRDGTIIEERNYLSHPDEIKMIPGAAAALRRLKELGLGVAIVTNQSGVSRGYFDEARLTEIHDRLEQLLGEENVRLDGIYVCPHLPEDGCACRKPEVGLIKKAAEELCFDPEWCFVIGDKPCDIEMGRRIGAMTFLVRTGYGAQLGVEEARMADYQVDDLTGAVEIIARLRTRAIK
jgi:D-glycero-D-manno-heptose 1,7-bisphosphate phosphatase